MTTSQFPDHISFDQLQDLANQAASAPTEETNTEDGLYGDDRITKEQLLELVDHFCQESINACDDPMIHKCMIMRMLGNFIDWHTKVGNNSFKRGEAESGVSWLRDAGKFQAAMCIIADINVSPDDFITPMKDDESDDTDSDDQAPAQVWLIPAFTAGFFYVLSIKLQWSLFLQLLLKKHFHSGCNVFAILTMLSIAKPSLAMMRLHIKNGTSKTLSTTSDWQTK